MYARYKSSNSCGEDMSKMEVEAIIVNAVTDREPVVAVVVVPVDIAGIEVHVPRVVRIIRIERGRPVVAVGTHIVQRGVVPVACGGKKSPSAGRLAGGSVPPLSFSEVVQRYFPGRAGLD